MNAMTTAQKSHYRFAARTRQQGISLYIIIILVMLSMLLALWASRTALFNEMMVGNDADYRRTFEAAQTILQDAELDIRGVNPDATLCTVNADDGDICRRTTAVYFDIESKDLETLFSSLDAEATKCSKGICQKRADPQDFWNKSADFVAMTAPNIGARYGQFTGAKIGAGGNPILNDRAEPSDPKQRRGAWYWVEILPYIDPNVALLGGLPPGSNVELFAPTRKKLWVYRITALARGLKPNTEVVLQSTLSLKAIE